MENAIDKQIEIIREGIAKLEERTNFNVLLFRDMLPGMKSLIHNYLKSGNKRYLIDLINGFKQNSHASREGSAQGETIWDASIEGGQLGKSTLLGDLLHTLDELING